METRTKPFLLLLILFLAYTDSMVMRNNELMTKMVSKFQDKDKTNEINSIEPQPENSVISMMQTVLCKNFPSIPCDLITKDPTLRHLIEKSVQQMKYKQMTMEKTTISPNFQLTLFPIINSEDLSNFLNVRQEYMNNKKSAPRKKQKKQKKSSNSKNFWSHEAQPKKKESKTPLFNGRKKLRKFYPHKIKYKDKTAKKDFGDYSEEKLSMSVEVPESNSGVKTRHFSYRPEPSGPPVWRIDYMKHGEPGLNVFGYESENLQAKIIKTGPNVIVDDNLEQVARKDVLHPDVYIKKNYVRKADVDAHSDVY